MYHPYLFARRAELLALRDLAANLPISQTISPVLESVKADSADLRRALRILAEASATATVIVNPTEGEFKKPGNLQTWRESLTPSFSDYPSILPGYVCRPGTKMQQISAFLGAYAGRPKVLLYWSPSISDADLNALASINDVSYHINLLNQMSTARRALLPQTKAVDIDDHFAKSERNADYGGPEFFSDDHLTYQTDSVGFGDYSIVGAKFVAGGGLPYAIAIHGMYRVQGNALWLEHFISDDIDKDVGTVEGKYLQAATKLADAVQARPQEFGQDAALDAFATDVQNLTFPGLAGSKRRQIYHHLAIVHGMIV